MDDQMNDEKDFVEKAKQMSFALLQTMETKTIGEDPELGIKICLLALTKVSSSILHMLKKIHDDDDEVVSLFVSTVIESIKALDDVATAVETTNVVLDKMMRKA